MPNAVVIAVPVPEACRITSLGRSKLYEEIAAGRIEARKAGKRTLVLLESLRAYVNELPPLGSAGDEEDPNDGVR